MPKRNDELWMHHLNVFKEYIQENHKLPTNDTIYKNFKLGLWIANQRNALKNNLLSNNRLLLLNEINPYWNGTTHQKLKENKKLLINSDWENKVPYGNTPINRLYSDDNDLYVLLSNGILDCESLIKEVTNEKIIKKLSKFDIVELYCKLIPYIDYEYANIFFNVYYSGNLYDIDRVFKFTKQFAFKSPQDMKSKLNTLMSSCLNDRERIVICRYFGIEHNTLSEIGEIFNVTNHRIRQILCKAIRKMRYRNKILFQTNTILDSDYLSNTTRSELYRSDICTEVRVKCLLTSSNIDDKTRDELESFLISLHKENNEDNNKNLLETTIEDLNLSVRTFNCLRRAGLYTVKDIIGKDKPYLLKLRNFGDACLNEVIQKLSEFDLQLKD